MLVLGNQWVIPTALEGTDGHTRAWRSPMAVDNNLTACNMDMEKLPKAYQSSISLHYSN